MLIKLKRFLASNKYFWKYRHLFQQNVFDFTYGIVPAKFFNNTFKKIKVSSVLDFGCGAGDKLLYFIQNKKTAHIYGIDINQAALLTAKKKTKLHKINKEFSDEFDSNKIKHYMKRYNINKFDLIIFDRVLYILNNNSFYKLINECTKISKYIYVDDFFIKNYNQNISHRIKLNGYMHTDYNKIFKKKKFRLVITKSSPYPKVKYCKTKFNLYKLDPKL